jgi:hypothetical protein
MKKSRCATAAAALTVGLGSVLLPLSAATAAKNAKAVQAIVLLKVSATAGANSHVRYSQSLITHAVNAGGGRVLAHTTTPNALVISATASVLAALRASGNVLAVVLNGRIHGPSPVHVPLTVRHSGKVTRHDTAALCGTAANPQLNPKAVTAINAPAAWAAGATGSSVTVAYMADGIDTTIPDLQRNPLYASTSSAAGSAVITDSPDFSGDGNAAETTGGEAFLDASSIAAQGNSAFDISDFSGAPNQLPSGCDIKVVGAAPGASIVALKVFGRDQLFDDRRLHPGNRLRRYPRCEGAERVFRIQPAARRHRGRHQGGQRRGRRGGHYGRGLER